MDPCVETPQKSAIASLKTRKLRAGLSEKLNRDEAPPFQEGTIQALFKISKKWMKTDEKANGTMF